MGKTKHKKSTIIHAGSDKPKAAKSAHYVNNEDFYREMKEWKMAYNKAKRAGKPLPRIPEPVGAAILKIAYGLGKKINFVTKKYVDEMISDAIENCIMYAANFNHRKYKNPFSYFTQICYYAFLRRISKEKKQTYIRYKMMMNSVVMGETGEVEEFDQHDAQAVHALDNMDLDNSKMEDFVVDFEKKHFGQVATKGAIGRRKRKPKMIENNLNDLI